VLAMGEMFKKYTAYEPVRTYTTTTARSCLSTVSPKCWGCKFSYVSNMALVCACASRTLRYTEHGEECVSYIEKGCVS